MTDSEIVNRTNTRNEETSDHTLLKRISSGQEDAATALFLRYASRLQSFAKSRTASALSVRFDEEDVVQSVFRTFFRRASEGFYNVPPGDQLWQLLLVITLNKVRKLATHHRAQKRDVSKTVLGEAGAQVTANSPGSDEHSLKLLQLVIEESLENYSPSQKQIIELRIEGYEIDEIASKTERSKRTVERILQKFRTMLTSKIEPF